MHRQDDRFLTRTYEFDLPQELIAQRPAEPRDSARMLVIDRSKGRWEHRTFRDLPEYLDSRDLLVANNSRVMAARLVGWRETDHPKTGKPVKGGKVEFLLLEKHPDGTWEAMYKAAAKGKPGFRFVIADASGAEAVRGEITRASHESPTGTVRVRFDRDPLRANAGHVPLPPYIRSDSARTDRERYQTVYAKEEGSAAAPTAGFHFTPELLERLRAKGAGWDEVTLHVGIGTFRPVKSDDVREHVMHEEAYLVPDAVASRVTEWKRGGGRVVAVGTTAVRTLESAWSHESRALAAGPGRTSIFIHPGAERRFGAVDRLITNFHLPGSTLLMLVCAFAGTELTLAAYREAIRERYRFYSYGDGMLIL